MAISILKKILKLLSSTGAGLITYVIVSIVAYFAISIGARKDRKLHKWEQRVLLIIGIIQGVTVLLDLPFVIAILFHKNFLKKMGYPEFIYL